MPKWRLASIGPALASVDLSFNTMTPVSAGRQKGSFLQFYFCCRSFIFIQKIFHCNFLYLMYLLFPNYSPELINFSRLRS